MKDFQLSDFPIQSHDKLRYSDTDRQGHVNNAKFVTFLETGRVDLVYNPELPLLEPNASFVIVNLELSFLAEVKWPGRVDIGTGVQRIGTSSITMEQAVFQNGNCVSRAISVTVQVDEHGNSKPLSDKAKAIIANYLLD